MTFRNCFATRFKELRLSYNISGIDMAKLLCLKSAAIITYWEKGTNIPSLNIFYDIVNLFSVNASWLLGTNETKYEESLIIKNEEEICSLINDLSLPIALKTAYQYHRNEIYTIDERTAIIVLTRASLIKSKKFLPLLIEKLNKP